MARRKQAPKDLTGIPQRGGRYQIRLFGGQDLVTGKQVILTGSAEDEDAAIKLRDKFRGQVADLSAAVQGSDVRRAPHASGAQVRQALRRISADRCRCRRSGSATRC